MSRRAAPTNMISEGNLQVAKAEDEENACDQEYTLEINAPFVQFSGIGDRHESFYDSMVLNYDFGSIEKENERLEDEVSLLPSLPNIGESRLVGQPRNTAYGLRPGG
jgi:hypothetical protein